MPTTAFGGEGGRPRIPLSEIINHPAGEGELEQGGEREALDVLREKVRGYLSEGLTYDVKRAMAQAREQGLSLTLDQLFSKQELADFIADGLESRSSGWLILVELLLQFAGENNISLDQKVVTRTLQDLLEDRLSDGDMLIGGGVMRLAKEQGIVLEAGPILAEVVRDFDPANPKTAVESADALGFARRHGIELGVDLDTKKAMYQQALLERLRQALTALAGAIIKDAAGDHIELDVSPETLQNALQQGLESGGGASDTLEHVVKFARKYNCRLDINEQVRSQLQSFFEKHIKYGSDGLLGMLMRGAREIGLEFQMTTNAQESLHELQRTQPQRAQRILDVLKNYGIKVSL